ncbi:MAG: hypothetical protein RL462_1127 [Pseudomonadota bacterium]
MRMFRQATWLIVFFIGIFTLALESQAAPARSFTIYAFIPWSEHITDDGLITQTPKLTDYLQTLGIQPIWVIYESRYTHVWDGQLTSQVKIIGEKKETLVIDEEKIKAIALDAMHHPEIPVSFDTEFGNRFQPETVQPGVLETIKLFKKYNDKNKVGVYAVAPQVVFAWRDSAAQDMQKLNTRYESVANAVDFLSPTIYYRYNVDLPSWKKTAGYSIQAAKSYQTGKPIIPYLSFNYSDHGQDSEKDANERLEFLYQHGAAGCIIWGSSSEKTFFDRNSGWSKAMVDFAAAHR